MVQFDAWIQSGKTAFSFVDVLGQLNELNDPIILDLYELLGQIGELPETYQDQDFFVNNLTGDDINGLGTELSPWATVGRALDYLRNTVIKHRIHILAAHTAVAGQTTYTETAWFLDHTIDGGSLAIIGVGAPIETKQATQIAVETNLGKGAIQWNQIDLSWTVNDWIGEFVMGPDAKAYPVHKNTDSDLWIPYVSVANPGVGDPIRGVIPAVIFKLPNLNVRLNETLIVTGTGGYTPVAIVNCNLDFTDSNSPEAVLTCAYSTINFDFVVATFLNTKSVVLINESLFNSFPPVDTTLAAASETGITNIGASLSNQAGLTVRGATKQLDDHAMIVIHNSSVNNVTNSSENNARTGNVAFNRACALKFEGEGANALEMSHCFASSETDDYGIELWQTNLELFGCYFGQSAAAIKANLSRMEIRGVCECDALCTYALQLEAFVHCHVEGDQNGFVGATDDIRFMVPAAPLDASWPADGVSVDDGVAASPTSIVVRKD